MKDKPIRVLMADDSLLWSSAITELLESQEEIRVVARVGDGRQAVEETARLHPDLVIMDLRMPVLGGLEAIEQIMAQCPTPILVLTAQPGERQGALTFDALRRGALDLMVKDASYPYPPEFVRELIGKVVELSQVKVVRHFAPRPHRQPAVVNTSGSRRGIQVVAIVASTGGPAALATILSRLPADFGAGIVVVQHLADNFAGSFAHWLDGLSPLSVAVAAAGDRITPGRVLVAPDRRHLLVRTGGGVYLQDAGDGDGHCPSGDQLLSSVAASFGTAALGLVLTGMGNDGARGLMAVHRAGGRTLAQDQKSSAVFSMPKAAFESGGVDQLVSLDGIVDEVSLSVGRLHPETRSWLRKTPPAS